MSVGSRWGPDSSQSSYASPPPDTMMGGLDSPSVTSLPQNLGGSSLRRPSVSFRSRMLDLVAEHEHLVEQLSVMQGTASATLNPLLTSSNLNPAETSNMVALDMPEDDQEDGSPRPRIPSRPSESLPVMPERRDSSPLLHERIPRRVHVDSDHHPPPEGSYQLEASRDAGIQLPGFRLGTDNELVLHRSLRHLMCEGEATSYCPIISPVGMFRISWDIVLMCLLLVELWMTPFELVFMQDNQLPASFDYINHGITGYFTLDILLNFNTGFFARDKIVMDHEAIVREYMKFWFWLDLLTTMPLHVFVSHSAGGFVRLLRFAKMVKTVKVFRLFKLFRTVKLLTRLGSLRVSMRLRYWLAPIQMLFVLTLAAHVHGCIRAYLVSGYYSEDFSGALRNYYENFRWAYTAFTMGALEDELAEARPTSPGLWTLDIIVASERLFFLAFVGTWGLFVAQCHFQDEVRNVQLREDALEYLHRHNISISTRIQILYILHETGKARNKQRHFRELLENDLPNEMYHKISTALWSTRLSSLGLISGLEQNHFGGKFVERLSLIVREEVLASECVLFRYGDTSLAAYCVVSGTLRAHAPQRKEADYVAGQWIGENALVNPYLRRNRTIVSNKIVELMRVPSEGFHEVLVTLGLDGSFKQLCREHLWKGLCGRCGSLGDHFPDDCPGMRREEPSHYDVEPQHSMRSAGFRLKLTQSICVRSSTSTLRSVETTIRQDLHQFLAQSKLDWLEPHLLKLQCRELDDLAQLDFESLRALLPPDEVLTEEDLDKLSPSAIARFRENVDTAVQRVVFDHQVRDEHFIFLSHCKKEAGTEAALMRTELEQVLSCFEDLNLRSFNTPIFLDSDDLVSLEGVQAAVRKSHNLVVMLTNEVLSRPWVLIEIVTAYRCNLPIMPVEVKKPGNTFEFPDEGFYARLFTGDFLHLDGHRVLRQAGVQMAEVERALRKLFTVIAVHYSPHRSAEVRQAELKNLLRRCRVRKDLRSGSFRTSTHKQHRNAMQL